MYDSQGEGEVRGAWPARERESFSLAGIRSRVGLSSPPSCRSPSVDGVLAALVSFARLRLASCPPEAVGWLDRLRVYPGISGPQDKTGHLSYVTYGR